MLDNLKEVSLVIVTAFRFSQVFHSHSVWIRIVYLTCTAHTYTLYTVYDQIYFKMKYPQPPPTPKKFCSTIYEFCFLDLECILLRKLLINHVEKNTHIHLCIFICIQFKFISIVLLTMHIVSKQLKKMLVSMFQLI